MNYIPYKYEQLYQLFIKYVLFHVKKILKKIFDFFKLRWIKQEKLINTILQFEDRTTALNAKNGSRIKFVLFLIIYEIINQRGTNVVLSESWQWSRFVMNQWPVIWTYLQMCEHDTILPGSLPIQIKMEKKISKKMLGGNIYK